MEKTRVCIRWIHSANNRSPGSTEPGIRVGQEIRQPFYALLLDPFKLYICIRGLTDRSQNKAKVMMKSSACGSDTSKSDFVYDAKLKTNRVTDSQQELKLSKIWNVCFRTVSVVEFGLRSYSSQSNRSDQPSHLGAFSSFAEVQTPFPIILIASKTTEIGKFAGISCSFKP